MANWKDFKSFREPLGMIVGGLLVFIVPGLLGWLFVSYADNVKWLRLFFEFVGLCLVLWGIKDLVIFGNTKSKKVQKKRNCVRILFYFISLLLLGSLIAWTAWDNGYKFPPLPTAVATTTSSKATESVEPTIPTRTPLFSRFSIQSAEEITSAYYLLLADQKYEDAYSLLNEGLRKTPNFVWEAWSAEVSRNTYEIVGDLIVNQEGNVFRVEFELLSTPNFSSGRIETWTFCITNFFDYWEIRDFRIESQACW